MDLSKYEKKHVLEKAGMEHACTEKMGLRFILFGFLSRKIRKWYR